MLKAQRTTSHAFTLIEVMVAVLIISVVIMALLQMKGNSSHIFFELSRGVKINQFASTLLSNKDYGFENKNTTLDKLLDDFEVTNKFSRELKSLKVEVIYQKLELIDMSEQSSSKENVAEISSPIVFEIGKTTLKMDSSSIGLIRLRAQ